MVYVVDEGNEGPNLYIARPPFSEATSERLEATRSKDWEYVPYLSADDTELYFVRRPSDGELNSNDSELWIAPRTGETFGAPSAVDELNLAGVAERSPVLSADGLRLYFASNRPTGSGPDDIYVATRASVGGRFGQPVPVTELNTSSRERPNWISPDDCSLYFASDRPGTNGGMDLWRAERERRF
jgi:Tol biopolymer transport system component